MKTLIELWDERPIENVLAAEMFRPEEIIYVCPPEIAADHAWRASLSQYFRRRGCDAKLTFRSVSLLNALEIRRALKRILKEYEDCAIDISGGTDAALFAAGAAAGTTCSVFTYSHKRNTFFEIQNAPYARSLECTVKLDVASCFLMAGGQLLPGREDNRVLRDKLPEIDRLFDCFSRFRTVWAKQIKYIQRISDAGDPSLLACGSPTEKVDNGMATADPALFAALQENGLISDLAMTADRVAFRLADEVTRFWLRDVGSVLELYVWKTCRETGVFDDVVLSAVVNWRGEDRKGTGVTNEIDVMAVRGVQPMFISCKTSEIKTEALNELAILRDRFGGEDSRAMIVTSAGATRASDPMRKRAAELGIEVVDWHDLSAGRLGELLKG